MYIPYFEIAKKISSVLPERFKKPVEDFGCKLKIKQNLAYISKNQIKVKQKLKKKQVLNVAFYVYDDTKWKCQSVYDLMIADERFTPCIIATKNAAENPDNPSYQTKEDVIKTYNFFKTRNMNVKYGYDIDNERFIPLKEFSPDIIIYQHPWYVETSQGPVVCSEFALTCYVPYFISDTDEFFEYDLRFHKYIYKHYVPNEIIRKNYAKKMADNKKSLVQTGHPQLDYFYLNKPNKDKKYLIYAPHWSVCGNNIRYSTFDWSGYEILRFAKSHPELNWIFKPHPLFYRFLYTSGYMTKEKANEYFKEWESVGQICNSGDYLEIFQQSYAMITDSGSFLNEYFMTGMPLIHLMSDHFIGNESVRKICSSYYTAHNIEELNTLLNDIILNNQDPKLEYRQTLKSELNLDNNYSAQNIIQDITYDLW